jgi:hypothetical protein
MRPGVIRMPNPWSQPSELIGDPVPGCLLPPDASIKAPLEPVKLFECVFNRGS